MSNHIILTRRGRQVRALLLLAGALVIVAVVLWVLMATGHHAPISDAQWRDALADAQWRMAHKR